MMQSLQSGKLDFVTVTFSQELRFLQLQALSMAKYVPSAVVGNIFIIINEEETPEVAALIEETVIPLYGHLSCKTVVICKSDLIGAYSFKQSDWFSQQVLKLKIANKVTEEAYIVLDSKNHFIRPVSWDTFVSPSGLLKHRKLNLLPSKKGWLYKLFVKNKTRDDKLALPKRFAGSFEYFGLSALENAAAVVPTTTPFPLYRAVSLGLIKEVETNEKISFEEWFDTYTLATEFYLSQAYPAAKGVSYSNLYEETKGVGRLIFDAIVHDEKAVKKRLLSLEKSTFYSFGLHRKSVEKASPEIIRLVGAFWRSRGLIERDNDAHYFFELARPENRVL